MVKHGVERSFYVDFIVMQKGGRVGLFPYKKEDLLLEQQNHEPRDWQNILQNKTRKVKNCMAELY